MVKGEREELWGVLPELGRREHQIQQALNMEDPWFRTRVAVIDYAVDQMRFFRAAWRALKSEGHTDQAALEQVELLSLLECLRRAKVKWKKDRLLQYAGCREWHCWQRVLDARTRTEEVNLLPRWPGWPGPTIQCSPYPSSVHLSARISVTLEVATYPNAGLRPSAVHPIRPMGPNQSWSLQLVLRNRRRWLRVFIDPPWDFDRAMIDKALHGLAEGLEGFAASAAPDPTSAMGRIVEGWRESAAMLRTLAAQLRRASPGKRAGILQRRFILPGASYLSPVAFVTDDMRPDVMAMILGFKATASGLLSTREGRRFVAWVGAKLLLDYPELTPQQARILGRRLSRFQRPLSQESVRSFGHKTLKGLQFPRTPKEPPGKALQRLAHECGVSVRTVYRKFANYIEGNSLGRNRRAVRLFVRFFRRQMVASEARAGKSNADLRRSKNPTSGDRQRS